MSELALLHWLADDVSKEYGGSFCSAPDTERKPAGASPSSLASTGTLLCLTTRKERAIGSKRRGLRRMVLNTSTCEAEPDSEDEPKLSESDVNVESALRLLARVGLVVIAGRCWTRKYGGEMLLSCKQPER
jgi:hypothetical protein